MLVYVTARRGRVRDVGDRINDLDRDLPHIDRKARHRLGKPAPPYVYVTIYDTISSTSADGLPPMTGSVKREAFLGT